MLKGRNILCISNPSWEGDYAKTIVELMKVFGKNNRILYVDNPYTIKDLLSLRNRHKIPFKKILGLSPRIRKESTPGIEVFILTPPVVLTINFLPKGMVHNFFMKLNGLLVTYVIRKWLKRLKMTDKLIDIVAFNPALGITCGRKFNESVLIYHCYDNIESAPWLQKHGPDLEKKFMEIADAVIVTSLDLYEKKKPLSNNCFLVKNGVDINLFAKTFKEQPLNVKLNIGYTGSIDERLDYSLLQNVIESMSEYNFIFIGRINSKEGEQILRKYPNVTLTGPKNIRDLPGQLQTFSVGIIPFIKSSFTKGIYPLKVNEYLATGLPVVSTSFSNLDDFKNVISIAEDATDFKQKLLQEMSQDAPAKRQKRLQTAKQNSWELRAEEISSIIDNLEKR